jgi:ubiquinone/menaquinone biosynthesis C-methylase UbiE
MKLFRKPALLLLTAFLLFSSPFYGQTPARPTSTPYSGDLSIFETPGREQRLQIQRVMDLLGVHAGSNVADIGAGSGWFTVRAAARVGATGTVYAEDINPDAIDYIRKRAVKQKLGNIQAILGTTEDPKLPPGSIDAVLMLKAYHEVENPPALLRNLKASLRPGAKVGILDHNGDGTDHGIMPSVVEHEMRQAGFRLIKNYDFPKDDTNQYFLLFEAAP